MIKFESVRSESGRAHTLKVLEVNGTTLELAGECCAMIREIWRAMNADDPCEAGLFRDSIMGILMHPDSVMGWYETEGGSSDE